MTRKLKAVFAIVMAAGLAVSGTAQVKYEAEEATRSGNATLATHASASGGSYVEMREGDLTFLVQGIGGVDFYDITLRFSQPSDPVKKEQKLHINGSEVGTVIFPNTGSSVSFQTMKAASKVKLNSSDNNIVAIVKDWGWVDIDYMEIAPHEAVPFDISNGLVNPNATARALKMYRFMREKFGTRVISGVMSGPSEADVTHAQTINSITEVAHVRSKSGNKTPALIGFDIMHGTGKDFDAATDPGTYWGRRYTDAAVRLAGDLYDRGGIPHFMWHWRDPSKATNEFYTKDMAFDISKAFPNGVAATNSDEYKAIVRDIDSLAVRYLKPLADDDIPVLWRPLHEAAGGWFWWGAKGAAPNKALWIYMYDRLTNHHNLNNLIWVWTCEEGSGARDWYPGDEYADIIGRDIYPNPQTAKIHISRVSNFENLKDIYGAKKIIALTENGAVPLPDNLADDGAGWSFFMSWDRNFVTDVNTDVWNEVMNHPYVITLSDMPGWDNYTSIRARSGVGAAAPGRPSVSIKGRTLSISSPNNNNDVLTIRMIDVRGKTVARYNVGAITNRPYTFSLTNIPAGKYFVDVRGAGFKQTLPVVVK